MQNIKSSLIYINLNLSKEIKKEMKKGKREKEEKRETR
jgi:hypothetical protein